MSTRRSRGSGRRITAPALIPQSPRSPAPPASRAVGTVPGNGSAPDSRSLPGRIAPSPVISLSLLLGIQLSQPNLLLGTAGHLEDTAHRQRHRFPIIGIRREVALAGVLAELRSQRLRLTNAMQVSIKS